MRIILSIFSDVFTRSVHNRRLYQARNTLVNVTPSINSSGTRTQRGLMLNVTLSHTDIANMSLVQGASCIPARGLRLCSTFDGIDALLLKHWQPLMMETFREMCSYACVCPMQFVTPATVMKSLDPPTGTNQPSSPPPLSLTSTGWPQWLRGPNLL